MAFEPAESEVTRFTDRGMPIMQRTIISMSVSAACAQIGRDWQEAKQREAFERQSPVGKHVMIENAKLRLRAEEALLEKMGGAPA